MNLPAPATDETCGNNRLFEAVSRLIRTWATRRPLVLLLDDMQWADPATLDLLHYLARSLAEQPMPILLLFNLSTGPGDCTEAQMSWLLALKRTRLPLTELRLAPFTQEETRQFVQELKWARQPIEMDCTGSSGASLLAEKVPEGQQALSSFSHWLFRHTSGQPLYLRETLNELMARDILFLALQESGAWGLVLRPERLVRVPEGELIPQALRELMRSRITQLSPSAWMLLATASALEAGLSFERLCQVAGLDELEGLDVLEELLRGGWLSEATVLAGASLFDNYAFPCQIIREVVYQEAGATRRRIVQRRLAALIRAGIAGEQEEEVRVPHASTTEEYARSEKSTDTGLPVMARTLSHRSAGQWKTRKEENDAIHTTHTTPRRLPGAKNSGWRAGYTVPGR